MSSDVIASIVTSLAVIANSVHIYLVSRRVSLLEKELTEVQGRIAKIDAYLAGPSLPYREPLHDLEPGFYLRITLPDGKVTLKPNNIPEP